MFGSAITENYSTMKTLLLMTASTCALTLVAAPADQAAKDTRFFELRTYYAAPGKLDDLHARFRDHTMKLFEKHGMVNIGYWVPLDNTENKLVYLLAYPSREARAKSWKEFSADSEWREVAKKSEANGRLVSRVESVFLTPTDYSPEVKTVKSGEPRVFELRTYTTPPDRLEALNARFRDHTLKLFTKHGMTNIGYWTPTDKNKGADNTLIYMLAHKSQDAAKKSFDTFRQDPDWVAARKASEDKAGGSLTVADGVKSVFLTATDYSPMK